MTESKLATCSYESPTPWTIVQSPDEMKIVPQKFEPKKEIMGAVLLLVAMGAIAVAVLSQVGNRSLAWFALPLALIIWSAILGLLEWQRWAEFKRGPWLVCDKKGKLIELPRKSLKFAMDRVEGIQIVTGQSKVNGRYVAQLHLLIRDEARPILVVGAYGSDEVQHAAGALAVATHARVSRVNT